MQAVAEARQDLLESLLFIEAAVGAHSDQDVECTTQVLSWNLLVADDCFELGQESIMYFRCHRAVINVSHIRVDLKETNHVRILDVVDGLRLGMRAIYILDFAGVGTQDCWEDFGDDLVE